MAAKRKKKDAWASNPHKVQVVVMGIVDAGKSTLINRILGERVCDTSPIPGWTKKVKGHSLKDWVVIADTPGLQDVDEKAAEATMNHITRHADVVVFMFMATLGVTRPQIEDFRTIKGLGKPVLPVINWIDQVEDKDRKAVIRKARESLGVRTVVPTSAKTGENVEAVTEWITATLEKSGKQLVWEKAFHDRPGFEELLKAQKKKSINGLAGVLDIDTPTKLKRNELINEIKEQLVWYSSGLWGKLTREWDEFSYDRIVIQTAKNLDVGKRLRTSQEKAFQKLEGVKKGRSPERDLQGYRIHKTTVDLEREILQKMLSSAVKKMKPEQRKQFETKVREIAETYDKKGALAKSGTALAVITAGQLSGFGIYMLASTVLGGMTGILGFTLPFAVYTSMSSAISIIIGPPGWVALGLWALLKLTGPNYQRLIGAIAYTSLLRHERAFKAVSEMEDR